MRRVNGSTACFSTSSTRLANRAIVYSKNGEPSSVLSVLSYPTLPPPSSREVNIRFLLSPVNPADVNVIQGVYPDKPSHTASLHPEQHLREPVFPAGNEGVAEITDVGDSVKGLKRGDWVVMARQQVGTWASSITLPSEDVIRVDRDKISEVNAATITVRIVNSIISVFSTNGSVVTCRSINSLHTTSCMTSSICKRATGSCKMVLPFNSM